MSARSLLRAGVVLSAFVAIGYGAVRCEQRSHATAARTSAHAAATRITGARLGNGRAQSCDDARAQAAAVLARPALSQDEAIDATTLGSDIASMPGCLDAVIPALGAATACTRGYAAIVSGIISSASASDDAVDRLVAQSPASCADGVLRALSTGAHATPRLVAFAEGASAATDPTTRTTAWLALGTLGRLSRAKDGGAPLADRVESKIRAELSRAQGDDRVSMLEAAGNAACGSCAPEIERAQASKSWDERRAAAAAWRFQEGSRAAAAMCASLSNDDSSDVRENAAWAMRWRDADDRERVECLTTAAATDETPAVRKAATISLIVLAEKSALARSALVHLTGDEYAPDVRQLAMDYASTTDALTEGS